MATPDLDAAWEPPNADAGVQGSVCRLTFFGTLGKLAADKKTKYMRGRKEKEDVGETPRDRSHAY